MGMNYNFYYTRNVVLIIRKGEKMVNKVKNVKKGLKTNSIKTEKKVNKVITECSKGKTEKKVKISSKVSKIKDIPIKRKVLKKSNTECSNDKKYKKPKVSKVIAPDTPPIIPQIEAPINSGVNVKGYKSKKICTECIDTSNLKMLKFLGWCPSDGCTCSITSADLVGRDRYRCIRCGNKCLFSELLKEEKKGRARLSLRDRNECLEEMSIGISMHDVPDIPDTFKDIDLGEDWD
jgi:hypothetical protein